MKKDKAVAAPVRAVDPDMTLNWTFEGVTYTYRQPAGVFAATTQQDHGNMLIDFCVVSASGLVGADELRAKGHAWSRIIPQPHANRLYIQLLTASALTEAEAEG